MDASEKCGYHRDLNHSGGTRESISEVSPFDPSMEAGVACLMKTHMNHEDCFHDPGVEH